MWLTLPKRVRRATMFADRAVVGRAMGCNTNDDGKWVPPTFFIVLTNTAGQLNMWRRNDEKRICSGIQTGYQ